MAEGASAKSSTQRMVFYSVAWQLPSILSGAHGERGETNPSLTGQQTQKKPEYLCSTFTFPNNTPSLNAYK